MLSSRHPAFSFPATAWCLFVLSLGALAFVFVMQYGFALQPCTLCLWQRVPYGLTALLALAAALSRPRIAIWLLGLCALSYLIGMGLAIFHSGVEHHLWAGTSSCAIQPLHGGSAEDIRAALLRTVAPRCDEIAWSVLGFSMANLNIAFSLALAFFATAAASTLVETTDRPAE